MGWARNYPPLIKGAGQVAAHLDQNPERNIYYWYYATQLLHNMKNQDWEKWNLKVRENLISTQVQAESCAKGSWDPFFPEEDRWGRAGGRLFLTSLSILTLEVYYRYLPLYRDEVMEKQESGPTADQTPAPRRPSRRKRGPGNDSKRNSFRGIDGRSHLKAFSIPAARESRADRRAGFHRNSSGADGMALGSDRSIGAASGGLEDRFSFRNGLSTKYQLATARKPVSIQAIGKSVRGSRRGPNE
jgi:hypothetical protein